MASMSGVVPWITYDEYDEYGPSLAHRFSDFDSY